MTKRDPPFWWLQIRHCRVCGQAWLFAQEERVNDVWIMRRLQAEELDAVLAQGLWPADFDKYLTLLRLGREAGHWVKWVNPIGDTRTRRYLQQILIEIKEEEPGLSLEEAAGLLGVTLSDLTTLSEESP